MSRPGAGEGEGDQAELRCAGLGVQSGHNALREGIAAVTARLEAGKLRVLQDRCPHLLAEAALCRCSDQAHEHSAEIPLDEHNHALAALRYLISRLDERRLGRTDGYARREKPARASSVLSPLRDESLWTRIVS